MRSNLVSGVGTFSPGTGTYKVRRTSAPGSARSQPVMLRSMTGSNGPAAKPPGLVGTDNGITVYLVALVAADRRQAPKLWPQFSQAGAFPLGNRSAVVGAWLFWKYSARIADASGGAELKAGGSVGATH